jgi:hypothetical protein
MRGAVPAVGMAWGLETVVDDELSGNEVVYMEAGDHERLLRLGRDQFAALMRDARHGQIASPHAPSRGLPPEGARAADRRSRIRARPWRQRRCAR